MAMTLLASLWPRQQHDNPICLPIRQRIITLGNLPSDYLDSRLQSYQGIHSTTGWLPAILYETVAAA